MKNQLAINYIYATISGMLFGVLVFGGKVLANMGFSLMEIIIFPIAISAICLSFKAIKDYKLFFSSKAWIVYPIIAILGQLGQFAPLYMGVSVSIVVFLLYVQPIWTILIETMFLKKKFSKDDLLITIIVITGLVVLVAPWKEASYSILGIIFALLGGVAISLWVIVGSKFSKVGMKPLSLVFYTDASTLIPFLILIYPIAKIFFPDENISNLSLDKSFFQISILISYTLLALILAKFIFYKSAKTVSSIHLGIILLFEPIIGTILDITFLDTILTWNIVVGGAIIIAGNTYLILKNSKK